jgi:uncharacterized membrane protein HdeD (DUF308 family)
MRVRAFLRLFSECRPAPCALQIVTGAITLVLAALVLLFPAVAVFVIVFWLSISLLFGGIDDMIVGIGAEVEESYLEITGAMSFIRKKEQKAAVT